LRINQGLNPQGQGLDSKFVLEDISRPRAKDNNTAKITLSIITHSLATMKLWSVTSLVSG